MPSPLMPFSDYVIVTNGYATHPPPPAPTLRLNYAHVKNVASTEYDILLAQMFYANVVIFVNMHIVLNSILTLLYRVALYV